MCMNENKNVQIIPIQNKLTLTLKEAAQYSNIGINRLSEMVSKPGCPFALFVGNKKLIKRKIFDDYINSSSTLYL